MWFWFMAMALLWTHAERRMADGGALGFELRMARRRCGEVRV